MELVLTSSDVARILGISKRTLQRLRSTNSIEYFMVRGQCRYSINAVQKLIEERTIAKETWVWKMEHWDDLNYICMTCTRRLTASMTCWCWDMSEAERRGQGMLWHQREFTRQPGSLSFVSNFSPFPATLPQSGSASLQAAGTEDLLQGGRREAIYQEQREGFQSGECGALYNSHSPKIQITKVFTIKHLCLWYKRKRVMNRTCW